MFGNLTFRRNCVSQGLSPRSTTKTAQPNTITRMEANIAGGIRGGREPLIRASSRLLCQYCKQAIMSITVLTPVRVSPTRCPFRPIAVPASSLA